MSLTIKQRLFVEYYPQTNFNGTEAARQAGYAGNDNTLAATASRLLRNVKIREEIERRLAAEAMSANEVLWRLGDMARGDLSDFFSVDPQTGKPSLDLRKAEAAGKLHLIKKLKYNRDGDPEIELYDPQKPLELLGKHFQLFVETFDHSVTVFDVDEWRARRKQRLAQIDDMPDPGESVRPSAHDEAESSETDDEAPDG